MSKLVPLNHGLFAIVDDEDYELVSGYTWRAEKVWSTYYAMTGGGRNKTIRMHKIIVNYNRVDHKNGNGLDNRKENLRESTNALNISNQVKRKNTKAKYKGLTWHNPTKKWQARIRVNYRRISLGYYENEEDGARAYDEAARKYFGEFAVVNFPKAGERSAL